MINFYCDKYMNGDIETNKCKVNGLKRGDEYPIMEGVECNECIKYYFPEGYEFVDTDDTGIYLKPIKPKYPKTYEECHELMVRWKEYDCNPNSELILCEVPIHDFCKLIVARNIYWKIAGEEMGLEKPWKPDWNDESECYYTISYNGIKIKCVHNTDSYSLFAFPTKEMLYAFYENFKDLIEQCKELL